MSNDHLSWLMEWFKDHCDEDWEHMYGVTIRTLDNPGWSVKISIQETELQEKTFSIVDIERTDHDWIFCKIENGFFKGYCGPNNLNEVLAIFRYWSQESRKEIYDN